MHNLCLLNHKRLHQNYPHSPNHLDSPDTTPITLRTNSSVLSLTSHCTDTRRRCRSTTIWSMTLRIPPVISAPDSWHSLWRMLRNAAHAWLYSCGEGTEVISEQVYLAGEQVYLTVQLWRRGRNCRWAGLSDYTTVEKGQKLQVSRSIWLYSCGEGAVS